jgi:hypothetical protein
VFGVGQTIDLTLALSEPVTVTGTPTLTLNDGGVASYVSGSGTASLIFRTTVAAGQNAATLAVIGASLPAGSAVRDAAGNPADLTTAIASFGGVSVNTVPPSITGTVAGLGVADNGTKPPAYGRRHGHEPGRVRSDPDQPVPWMRSGHGS